MCVVVWSGWYVVDAIGCFVVTRTTTHPQATTASATCIYTPKHPDALQREGRGVREGKVSRIKFRLSDWCRKFSREIVCSTWARPLLKVGQVPQFPKVWVC